MFNWQWLAGVWLGVLTLSGCQMTGEVHNPAPTPTSVEKGDIFKTTKPIVIDGVLDEPAWQKAVSIPIKYIYGGKKDAAGCFSRPSTQPHGIVKCTWDEHYLYIGYECYDENLVALSSDKQQGPPDNRREGCEIWHDTIKVDVVEFFIAFESDRFFWELHHNALNQLNDVWITVPDKSWPFYQSSMAGRWRIVFAGDEFLKDQDETNRKTGKRGHYTLATAVKLMGQSTVSTDNSGKDKDQGYSAELRLPWFGLGAPRTCQRGFDWKMKGREIRILGVSQNADLKDRYHTTAKTLTGGFFHSQAKLWPRYTLKK